MRAAQRREASAQLLLDGALLQEQIVDACLVPLIQLALEIPDFLIIYRNEV